MIEIEMSKDIKSHEPKIMSVFTLRQIICLSIGCAYGIPIAVIIPGDITVKVLVAMIAMTPAFAFGWVKLYGLPLEKYLYRFIINKWMKVSKRKYKTSGYIAIFKEDMDEYKKPVKSVIEKQFMEERLK